MSLAYALSHHPRTPVWPYICILLCLIQHISPLLKIDRMPMSTGIKQAIVRLPNIQVSRKSVNLVTANIWLVNGIHRTCARLENAASISVLANMALFYFCLRPALFSCYKIKYSSNNLPHLRLTQRRVFTNIATIAFNINNNKFHKWMPMTSFTRP